MTTYVAEHLWTGIGTVRHNVLIEVDGGKIVRLEDAAAAPSSAVFLPGLTMPGLVNAHSHAFHRALRGHTQTERGSFWTWRERMYAVAGRLDPENYERLATAVFGEMVLAGITTVGEFHYVHHQPDGTPYDDPSAMSAALVRAASAAGIRLTLLDTCYLAGGFGPEGGADYLPLAPNQVRFGDGSADAWAERATLTRQLASATVRVGAAIHSVRAVPVDQLATVAAWATADDLPLHAHVSEQPAENADSVRILGATPVSVLERAGALGSRSTAVHATHLTAHDIELLSAKGTFACFCVTTERDLADGIGPAGALAAAGAPLTLGSDSHATIDLLEEARGVELGERLASNRRGHFLAADLLTAATRQGATSLGWDDAGMLEVGALADFVTVSLDSVRLAGWSTSSLLEAVVFAATACDIQTVVVGGDVVVHDGRHVALGDVAQLLRDAIGAVTT